MADTAATLCHRPMVAMQVSAGTRLCLEWRRQSDTYSCNAVHCVFCTPNVLAERHAHEQCILSHIAGMCRRSAMRWSSACWSWLARARR